MLSILNLFCHVDDFWQWLVTWENAKLLGVARKRGPAPRLSLSEVITVLIHFHQSHYRDFKAFYTQHVCKHMRSEFPALVSYTRFVELMPSALPAMCLYLRVRFGQRTGVAFIDSTPLSVCHNRRIGRHRVFAEVARRGKSSMGWFYGFKLHLIVNVDGSSFFDSLSHSFFEDTTSYVWDRVGYGSPFPFSHSDYRLFTRGAPTFFGSFLSMFILLDASQVCLIQLDDAR